MELLFLVSVANGFDWSKVIGVWVRILIYPRKNASFIISKLTTLLFIRLSSSIFKFIRLCPSFFLSTFVPHFLFDWLLESTRLRLLLLIVKTKNLI